MYDVIVGATLEEVREFKATSPSRLYSRHLEVSPRSVDRLRGIEGVDTWVFLHGFLNLPAGRQEGVRAMLDILRRESRGDVTDAAMWWQKFWKGENVCSHQASA